MLSPDADGVGGVGVKARRMPSGIDVDDMFFDQRFKDFPHVLGLNICGSDIVWFLELRRLRRLRLKERVKLC